MGSSATGPRPGRLLLLYGGIVFLLFVAVPAGVYFAADPEKLDIDQSVRDKTPGQFARLSDGYTHYEIGGPPDGRVVVLAAGATVPYYIWDPTFSALVGAGFRVLRYDYYGRGFSDRPDVPWLDGFAAAEDCDHRGGDFNGKGDDVELGGVAVVGERFGIGDVRVLCVIVDRDLADGPDLDRIAGLSYLAFVVAIANICLSVNKRFFKGGQQATGPNCGYECE